MFVLGIDPGLSRCGYGVVEQIADSGAQRARTEAVALGVIRTDADEPHAARLATQMHELQALISEFQPSVVAVERVFFQANARTAMGVAQVAGLAMAVAAAGGLEVVEYTPTQVKQAVAGWGGADKDQMKRMVGELLALPGPPEPADAADAAAVALCHLSQASWRGAATHARARVLLPASGAAAPTP
ncbi:MAG: crossover junction endodeoxyribonuclease RuvC [Acidimicrobiales bacterium]|nr:crossover junction endodeoxyribonuclease RuvC [Acidimicrobiales bacterium]MYD34828.1 crossover junction endodeoxyribonuclease RuvC [Acidimicrobiales bacterium]MYI10800.1 crossover junction endodeoxyribonuclease RuvC [Acidimicrobiales bacterium]